jgi:hypothetical protein
VVGKNFIKSEEKIREIINNYDEFNFRGNFFKIIICCKPRLQGSGGEVKTDIYLKAKNQANLKVEEFKISYKQPNWAFIENKVKKEKAEKIYGPEWSTIIQNQIEDIKDKKKDNFSTAKLFYAFKKKKRIYPGSFTLGWRYEIEKDSTRKLHAIIKEDIYEQIYISKGQHDKYRNALIDNKEVKNSGVPNYYFEGDTSDIHNIDDIMANIIPIADAMKTHTPCASFLAHNFDPINNKQHGGNKRDLGVAVKWCADDKLLNYEILYNVPLKNDSNWAREKLVIALHNLGIEIGGNFDIDKVVSLIRDKNIIEY